MLPCHAAFASQSLLTGLGSVQFISNLVFVVLVLREKVPLRCILATFLIVAGNVILVVFGSKTSPKYTVSQLAALYRQDSMAAYMIMAYGGGKQAQCLLNQPVVYVHLCTLPYDSSCQMRLLPWSALMHDVSICHGKVCCISKCTLTDASRILLKAPVGCISRHMGTSCVTIQLIVLLSTVVLPGQLPTR